MTIVDWLLLAAALLLSGLWIRAEVQFQRTFKRRVEKLDAQVRLSRALKPKPLDVGEALKRSGRSR